MTEELKGEGAADENTAKTLTELFRKNLNMEKLEVKAENLKNESVAANDDTFGGKSSYARI